MAAGIFLGTVAGALAAAAIAFDQGTGAHVTDLRELGFDLVAFELQGFQGKGEHGQSSLTGVYAVR